MSKDEKKDYGYSPDYYLCVDDKIDKGIDVDDAEALCEVLYG